MKHLRALAPCLLATALLSGCATFQDFLGAPSAERGPVLPPLAEREELEPISRNYFVLDAAGQTLIGEPQIVYTRDNDTFSGLAREYGLGYDELLAANPGVDPWLPGAKVPVLLPTQYVLPDAAQRGIVLNIAAKRLFYYPDVADGEPKVVMTYPIGIGRVGWETPTGEAKVVAKAIDPHWYVPWSVQQEHRKAGNPLPSIVPPGPDNPLGRHVLQLNMPGYLIHGTNKPWGVGMRVSHGCVRLYPENIELLYSLVMPGETVRLVNQPYLLGQRDGQVYLEAHAVLEDDTVTAEQHLANIFAGEQAAAAGLIDAEGQRDHARTIASEALGIPLRITAGDTLEIFSRVRVVRNTVKTDPDAPTLAEVRELLDEPPESTETSTDGTGGSATNVQAMDASSLSNLDD